MNKKYNTNKENILQEWKHLNDSIGIQIIEPDVPKLLDSGWEEKVLNHVDGFC